MQPSDRYHKQTLFAGIGAQGQQRLRDARALVVGCGALGSVIADQMARAGVGFLRIVDRDFVELSNLHRQVLYDEQDVADQLPKAVAAARKLRRINGDIEVDERVVDVDRSNILELADGMDVILDGTDNFEIRFLINDASLETGIPWVNGGCIGSHGQVMTIIPGKTACLRCLIETEPDPGTTETCDTAGVLGPAVSVIASLQSTDGLKILMGRQDLIEPMLTVVDIWDGTFRRLSLGDLPERTICPACKQGERLWLHGERGSRTTVLCGRNAVQVAPNDAGSMDLDEMARKLTAVGEVSSNPYLVRVQVTDTPLEITLFRDGRAIVKGTEDLTAARTAYARYIGS